MNCNCISRHGQALTEQLLAKGAENPRVFAHFVGMDFENGGDAILMTFTAHADNKPYSSLKGHPMSVVASFCPFCGVLTKTAPAVGAGC